MIEFWNLFIYLFCFSESTEDDAAVEEEAAEVAQTESVEPVAASAGDNKDKNTSNIMNTDTSKFPSAVWRSVNRADFPLDADLAEPQMVAAGYAVKGSEDRPVYYAWDADRIEAEKAAQNDNEPTETEEQKGGVEVEEGAAPSPAVESGEAHDTEVETAAPVASKFFNDTFTGVRCSEYDSRFAGFDSSNYMNEHVSRNVKKSLDGIMNQGIEGVFGGISSEYNEKYAPSPSKAAAPVMVDESVAADLAMPELENITPAPAMDAPSEQGQESSEETQAAPAEVAETPVETEMCFETEASIPEEASVPVPTEAPTAVSQVLSAAMEDNNAAQLFAPSSSGANPTAWGSVTHATYTWPEVQAQKDAKANTAAPADGDMIGGTMGTAPVMDGALDERLTSQLKQENTTRFTSESQSKFNWPCFDMNKRAASKTSDSLWVVGTRGDRSRKPEPKAPAEPHAGRSDHEADFDHLRGAAAMPLSADTLDVMEEKFSEDPIGKPTKKIGRDVAGDTPRSDMPLAGMIPNEQNHEKLVSKDSVIPGQIPKLRSGPADRIDILNHMALPRPKPAQIKAFPNSAAAGLTTGMGVGNMLDPVRCYPRYPQLSAKQANRWATSSAYVTRS